MHNLTYKRTLREDDMDIPQLITIYQTPEISQYLSISNNYFYSIPFFNIINFRSIHNCISN